MKTVNGKRLYTKANVNENVLIHLFGVEFGFINCSIHSIKELEYAVNKAFGTKKAIEEAIASFVD